MKIQKDDLTNSTSEAYKTLKIMTNTIDLIYQEYLKWNETNNMLVYNIQEGKITDTNAIKKAIGLLIDGTLSSSEIINKLIKE